MDKKEKKDVFFNFLMTKSLWTKIEQFAQLIELPLLNIKGGYKSQAVRMLIEDSLNRYMGPKNKDELVCPYADKMSDILPILENIRLRTKLEAIPEDMDAEEQKKEIAKIIKEFN